MSARTSSPIINDESAGEIPQPVLQEMTVEARQTVVIPSVKPPMPEMLTSETGVVAAVLDGENLAPDERQDASRTTAETSAVRETAPEKPAYTPNILIVEDDVDLAEFLQAALKHINVNAVYETHGQGALARFQEMKPDILLLDISLPDITGWRLLEVLKGELVAGEALPAVIVITAFGDPANRLIGKLLNVREYLLKPLKADEVQQVVLRAISSRTG